MSPLRPNRLHSHSLVVHFLSSPWGQWTFGKATFSTSRFKLLKVASPTKLLTHFIYAVIDDSVFSFFTLKRLLFRSPHILSFVSILRGKENIKVNSRRLIKNKGNLIKLPFENPNQILKADHSTIVGLILTKILLFFYKNNFF